MKNYVIYVLLLTGAIFCFNCSGSSNPDGSPTINIYSQMINTMSGEAEKSGDKPQGEVDSVNISKFRVLITEIKFHDESAADGNDKLLKTGPFVLTGDMNEGTYSISSGIVEEGTYDKIKFEIHRFATSELSSYADDETFGDFATDDRFTIIIEGKYYADGDEIGVDYAFNTDITENVTLDFDPAFDMGEGGHANIYIQMEALSALVQDGVSLDPDDDANRNKIEKQLKNIFKAVKKN